MPGMGGTGGTQIINGKPYDMYSPSWYSAWEQERKRAATEKGSNAAATAGAAVTGLQSQVPSLFGGNTSSSTISTGTGTAPAPAPTMPRATISGAGSGAITPGAQQPQPQPAPMPTGLPAGYAAGGNVALKPVDTSGAEAARFGRAKDTVGATTRSSLTGLRSALASRGQLGGGGELRGTESIIGKGMGALNDVTRQEAITGAETDQANAALEYTGGITQRGQNMTAQQASEALAQRLKEVSYQGDITQRGQDLAAAQNQQSFGLQEKQQQQNLLDRILSALTPLY